MRFASKAYVNLDVLEMISWWCSRRYRLLPQRWWCPTKTAFGNAVQTAFPKNLIFFLLKFNMICMFWIVLMCWCQKWFLKIEKNIIDMHFGTKSYLKSNRYHTVKHSLYQHWSTLAWNYWRRGGTRLCRHLFLWEKKSWQSVPNYHNLMNYTRWVL
jgi:hypothetical protein